MTNITTGRINFGPLHHSILNSTLGYESMFDRIETLLNQPDTNQDKYPPHNNIQIDEFNYIVELAVAGFTKSEIDITIEDGSLTIKGAKDTVENDIGVEYLHKGISNRAFTKVIRMVDTVEVKGAIYVDGILKITLENIIPEHKKPRKIVLK